MDQKNSSAAVISSLEHLLADNYTLYLKTQGFHWNVTGPSFAALHQMFQAQYEDLAIANDDIAERIRALGAKAPASFSAFAKLAKVKEAGNAPAWQDMVKTLAEDNATLAATAQDALKVAQETGDEATADLVIGRIAQHQKNKWMLDAHLG